MALRIKTLYILLCFFISTNAIAQEALERETSSKFSNNFNTWSMGFGASNFILYGDLKSIGKNSGRNFWNLGTYLYVDKMFNPVLGTELKINYSSIGGAGVYRGNSLILDGNQRGIELNGILNLTNLWRHNSKKWSMQFMAGIGFQKNHSRLTNKAETPLPENAFEEIRSSSMFLNSSLGVKRKINQKWDLEFRTTINMNNHDHLDAVLEYSKATDFFFNTNLGLIYKFGTKKKYAIWTADELPEETEATDYKDTDKDGVIDELDVEPETPEVAEVYGSGKAVDTDQDGLPDYKDRCPLAPGPVYNEGCPTDTDGDGILDIDDVCPKLRGTPEHLGCPKEDTREEISERIFLLAKSIYFKTNSSEIKDDSYNALNEIAQIMLEYPNTQFQIDGHTDDRSEANYNLDLSDRRAKSVLNHLTSRGINSARLYAKGYGEEKPTHSNDTEEGRKLNRRVEINFINPDSNIGQQIYDEDVEVNKYVDVIQPQRALPNKKDSDKDGVEDTFDQEPNTPLGAMVYGNGVAVDTDKDGIIDLLDQCPLQAGTPATKGCPLSLAEPVKKTNTAPTPKDTDGDGVMDAFDKDNSTPVGAQVYGNGMAVDTDNDGVIDFNDRCPLEPGENNGCPERKVGSKEPPFKMKDSDGDGVMDALDQEPNTPVGSNVYGNGISIDTDGDRIPDYSDSCPLEAGESSNGGCPKVMKDATGENTMIEKISTADTDGDGVSDAFDQELNTPRDARVYGNGVSVDTDGDSIPDHKDDCPLQVGEISNKGCPKVTESETGKTKIIKKISLDDADGDGVPDSFDQEPNTPKNARVYGNGVSVDTDGDNIPDYRDNCPLQAGEISDKGCPIEAEKPSEEAKNEPVLLTDSDGDGVIDAFDQDPNTPANVLVYGNGVPVDSDRDGLPDYQDECPLKSGPIAQNGCPEAPKELDWNDSDGDGVVNEFDKEPNTPKIARVYGDGTAIDTDGDSVPDHMDECPFDKGSQENKGCPGIKGAIKSNLVDTDKDGVLDLYDKEPDTPLGVKVYANGVSLDSDKDQVPDYKDRCPLRKGLVDNEGCPKEKDLDGDGVSDDDDLCPDIKGTTKNKGCPDKSFDENISVRIQNLASQIRFAKTKNNLTNPVRKILDNIVEIMQNYPATQYEIAAHTDSKSNTKYSLYLSKRRANAILKYLIRNGIQKDRLSAVGYGDALPKYPNDKDLATSELNNRIELNFVLPN
jgi:OOP family OmpA-OmpF porin